MKRLIIYLLLFLFYGNVIGQELKIVSIEETPKNTQLAKSARYDLNGNEAAIVILSFQAPIDFPTFKGNVIDRETTDDHTIALYVAGKTKRITIQHENYYPLVVDFNNNGISIESGHLYHVIIDNSIEESRSEPKQEIGSQYLVFKSKTKIKSIIVNHELWGGVEEVYGNSLYYQKSKMVPFGTYRYEAVSEDGKTIKGEVKVNSKLASKVVHLDF